ncbi:MAG: response regulator [Candidatus Latescibacterota bacterium]
MDTRNILLVEDDPNDIDLTRRAFRKSSIANELVVVRDGVQAMDYLFGAGEFASRNVCDTPAIILLDLKLPKVGGLEVLNHVRSDDRTRLIPVIIVTSSGERQDLIEGYRLGANSYVRKPIRFEDFIQAVQQLGMYWLSLNEPPPSPERRS